MDASTNSIIEAIDFASNKKSHFLLRHRETTGMPFQHENSLDVLTPSTVDLDQAS